MNKERLRAECLPSSANGTYVRLEVDGTLAGHAFACRWQCKDKKTICWVTQLVVHSLYRRRGLATHLLRALKEVHDDYYGIASSHPATCLAAATAFGCKCLVQSSPQAVLNAKYSLSDGISNFEPMYTSHHMRSIFSSCPVNYIRHANHNDASLDGTCDNRPLCSIDTGFYVDHTEPLEVLRAVHRDRPGQWCLGDLREGHEFLLILPADRFPELETART